MKLTSNQKHTYLAIGLILPLPILMTCIAIFGKLPFMGFAVLLFISCMIITMLGVSRAIYLLLEDRLQFFGNDSKNPILLQWVKFCEWLERDD